MFAPAPLTDSPSELIWIAALSGTPARRLALAACATVRLCPSLLPAVVVNVLDVVETWAEGGASEWEIEQEMGALRAALRRSPTDPVLLATEYAAALATVSAMRELGYRAADSVGYAVGAGAPRVAACLAVLTWVVEGRVAA
jgi:hypothetical protein